MVLLRGDGHGRPNGAIHAVRAADPLDADLSSGGALIMNAPAPLSQPMCAEASLLEMSSPMLSDALREHANSEIKHAARGNVLMAHAADTLRSHRSEIAALSSRVEDLEAWQRARLETGDMDAERIADLESNERAYEAALGQRTYNEVAEHIAELEKERAIWLAEATVEFTASKGLSRVTTWVTRERGNQIAADAMEVRAALTSPPEVKK